MIGARRKGSVMPVKRSPTGGALSWVVGLVLVGALAVGAGWLIGQQALNWRNPDQSSSADTDSGDTGYNYYPWKDPSTDTSQQPASSGAAQTQGQAQGQASGPVIDLPQSSIPATTPTSSPPASAASSKFYRVRVGSFGTREAAMETAMELEAQGHPIFVTGGGPWSVQVGAFAKRENAIALSDRLANQGYDVTIHE
jgi:cell division protein FtsN